ncbi:MAG: hypothetical protein ACI841_000729 [Planctomycetota bacterium]|jgi:hypothetical protein
MSKKCLMVLSPDQWREAAPIILLPKGTEPSAEMIEASGLEGAVVITVGEDGYAVHEGGAGADEAVEAVKWNNCGRWLVKLSETPDHIEQTIIDQTDWAAPEVRVYYQGETRPSLCCRLPNGKDAELVIGRSRRRSHLPLEDEHVSRRHARFYVQDGRNIVEDLDSKGGTFVNGEPIKTPHELRHQDKIRVGSTTLEFVSYLGILEQFERVGDSQINEIEAVDGPDPSNGDDDGERDDGRGVTRDRRPLWDTVMYAMAILTVLVATILVITEIFQDG